MKYSSEDKPGPGRYFCANCCARVVIDDPNEVLPICPECNCGIYLKM